METITTITVVSGYDKKTVMTLRELTFDEAKELDWRDEVKILDIHGRWRNCRVNGAVKTWKTRPLDLDIPMKYGLKECFHVRMVNGKWLHGDEIYVEVD